MLKAERLHQAHLDRQARKQEGGVKEPTKNVTDGINSFIAGYYESSPRTQSEKVTEFLQNELHQKNIKPNRIFSMADKKRAGSVKFSSILEALKKCCSSFTDELLSQIPLAFEINENDTVSANEFEMMLDPR